MAKNYTSKNFDLPNVDAPRPIVVKRILAFSKAYIRTKESQHNLQLLQN